MIDRRYYGQSRAAHRGPLRPPPFPSFSLLISIRVLPHPPLRPLASHQMEEISN